MLSKADQKHIKALQEGKARAAEGCFVAEGLKLTEELLGHFACELLVLPERRYPELEPLLRRLPKGTAPQRLELVPDSFDWTRISGLKQPQPQLAVLRLPQPSAPEKPRTSASSSTACRIRATWGRSSGRRTGSASSISTSPLAPPIPLRPRSYRLRWAHWLACVFIR